MDYHFRHLERLYRVTESCEIGAQLINVTLRRGENFESLRGRFPATLLWDTRMGYQPGRTEKLVKAASVHLESLGWCSESPEIFLVGDVECLFFRAVWPDLQIPFLMDGWRLQGDKQTLVLEDAPHVYPDPTICVTRIKMAGSGGRQSNHWTSTKKVPLTNVEQTFTLLQECAYNIFNGAYSGPEQAQYGGTEVYIASAAQTS